VRDTAPVDTEDGLTADDLDEIAARVERATPGPWHWITGDHDDYQVFGDGELTANTYDPTRGSPLLDKHIHVPLLTVWDNDGNSSNGAGGHEDAEFVAAARADVPALLVEVRRLRSLLEHLRTPG